MNDLEFKNKIIENFDNELPEYDEKILTKLQKEHRLKNQNRTKKNYSLKKILIPICFILILLPSILLPILLSSNEKYYRENDVEREMLTIDFAKDYIQSNYNYLSFIFSECDINTIDGYYINNNRKLVAISFDINKNDAPFTNIKINLIIDKRYKYNKEDFFVNNSNVEEKDNYKLYTKVVNELYNEMYYYFFEYDSYNLFITLNLPDEEFLNKLK